MSTTTTRQAYRRSYAPPAGSVDVDRDAGTCGCGQQVTLSQLFEHDCPLDVRNTAQRSARPDVATSHRDSLDVPEWRGGAGGHSPSRRSAPSPKQVSWLLDLYAKAGEDGAEQVAQLRDRTHASAEIERLQSVIRARNAAVQPAPQADRGCTPNRYPGDCRFCGGHVDAQEGLLCRVDGRWAVEHRDGQCDAAQAHTAAPAATVDVPAGHYAIQSTGANDLAFYRVDRPTEGDYAGRTFVKLVVGGKPDRNVRRDHVAGILARIAADQGAAQRYGTELGRCSSCNRTLTDQLSRSLGIGPECRSK